MNTDVKTWPLQLIFILTLIGGIVGLIDPSIFDRGASPSLTLPYVLSGVAVVSALLLYIPLLRVAYLAREGIGNPANPAAGTLLARFGETGNPGAGTLLNRIGSLVDAIGAPPNPGAGTLLERLNTLASALGTPAKSAGWDRFGAIEQPGDVRNGARRAGKSSSRHPLGATEHPGDAGGRSRQSRKSASWDASGATQHLRR